MKLFTTKARDGIFLAGHIHYSKKPKAVVIINPATAVNTRYYYSFAKYLTENNFHVITWNNRGFCESRPKDLDLAKVDYSYSDFGLNDTPAINDFVQSEFPNLAILGIGHSVGGQQLGLIDNHHLYKGFIAVATSMGYPPGMPLGYRIKTNFLFHMFGPPLIKFFGYVPAKRMGLMEDLPKNVFQVWKDWCLDPKFLFSEKFMGKTIPLSDFKNFNFPIHVIYSTDDEIASSLNIDSFWSYVKSHKPISFKSYEPKDLSQGSIKHFGYFRKKFKNSIWIDIVDKLNEFLGGKND